MHLTLAITGASGAILGRELLRALEADERVTRVHFVASENSLRVLAEELGVSGRTNLLEKLLGKAPTKTIQHADADIGAPIASDSHPSNGMIVLPCSMGTLAAIALGLANSLIARAADVTLKERRPLILCVRETPFNRIHMRNMARRFSPAFPRSTTTRPARKRWRGSLPTACWRTWACPSPARMSGSRKSRSQLGIVPANSSRNARGVTMRIPSYSPTANRSLSPETITSASASAAHSITGSSS